jgi:LAO/AO transport system kinase
LKKDNDIDDLIQRFKNGEKIALARLITIIENEPDNAVEIFKQFETKNNESYIVGITGSPGVGKSTLTGAITQKLLDDGKKVGIISVDPTSPFSGGAFLGDRIRMTNISLHPNLFMRSLASRGSKGGLSRAVFDISLLYEAFGMDIILIETVGAGQSEFEIYNLAYTVVVVLVPGYGDAIQMQKAGIIEIGDIYDVNKKDLGGEDVAAHVGMMLDDSVFQSGWRPPVLMTNAITGEGVEELTQNIFDHKEHVELSEELKKKKKNRFVYKVKALIHEKIDEILLEKLVNQQQIEKIATTALENSKFKIYKSVNDVFDGVNIDIEKKE